MLSPPGKIGTKKTLDRLGLGRYKALNELAKALPCVGFCKWLA
jgi:hypothetical protein